MVGSGVVLPLNAGTGAPRQVLFFAGIRGNDSLPGLVFLHSAIETSEGVLEGAGIYH